MNLMERDHHTEENDWREDLRNGLKNRKQSGIDEPEEMAVEDLDQEEREDVDGAGGFRDLLQHPLMTPVLLGIVVLLLVCMIVLLLFTAVGKNKRQSVNGDLQQNITQYAQEQKKNDYVSGLSGETVAVEDPGEKKEDGAESAQKQGSDTQIGSEDTPQLVAADGDKNAIVVDVEDESDVSYSKEYILNEALPFFADNNQDAIWDLAHLKRYVKLSEGLEKTGQYYYSGDVNSDGKPNGKGLAVYENNSYYYGDWVNGIRSGQGTWYRFYIGKKNKTNNMGKYVSHSYAGEWKNDLPCGQGAEHYEVDQTKLKVRERIVQNVVGNFTDGLYDGELYMNTVDYIGNVEEWSGTAAKGVFTLWRDMSAIGECSIWRKNDEPDLCIDIDQSENKNQGIRELLKSGS